MRSAKRFAISTCRAALAVGAALVIANAAHALEGDDDEFPLEPEEIAVEQSYDAAQSRLKDPHDPTRAAHPVRLMAYALHPVGVTLDYLLVRPATWVVRHEPFRTIFGYED